jgi:hypothetical protein
VKGKKSLFFPVSGLFSFLIHILDCSPGWRGQLSRYEKSSGIGLSFSRQVMRLHRGVIAVQSQPGASTVFTLRF